MENWKVVALDAYDAACAMRKWPRSCISRAYYAAYSVVSHELVMSKGVAFVDNRDGPAHVDVPELIENHLKKQGNRREMSMVKAAMRRLYKARIRADYRPYYPHTVAEATNALFDARIVLRTLKALTN